MTEMVIQQLLIDAGAGDVDQDLVMVEPQGLEVAADWRTLRSPETYLGHRQSSGFAQDGRRAVRRAPRLRGARRGCLSTPGRSSGTWTVAGHAAVLAEPGGRIAFQFHARDVNLVMGPASKGAVDPVPGVPRRREPAGDAAGPMSAPDGSGTLSDQRTYQLIRQTGPDQRAPVRDRVPRGRSRGVLLHVRLKRRRDS